MSKTAYKNPAYYSGPVLSLVPHTVRATDSKVWQAGTPAVLVTAGTWEPAASGTTSRIAGVFAEDQIASTSSTDVKVYKIDSSRTKFIGYISNDDADIVASSGYVGNPYGLHVSAAGLTTVNINDASGTLVVVDDLYYNLEPTKATSADTPALVVFHYPDAVLNVVA